MQIPFGEWLPDQPDHNKRGANVATNVYHAANTYKRFPSLVNYSSNTCVKDSRGAASFRDNSNTVFNFVATKDTLYSLSSGTFTDLGAAGKLLNNSYATCTITVTDYANIANGSTIVLTTHAGTAVTFTSTTGTAGTDEFKTETNNNTTADNIYTAINAHADFTVANPAAAIVTVFETTPAGTGLLTVESSDTVRLTVTNEKESKVKSVASISETLENQVWIVVERIINGSTVKHVEYLDSTLNMDSGLSGTVTGSSTTVTSLDHLEGETVQILIDDAVYPVQKVSSGAITVSLPSTFASKTIEVGLGYKSTIKTMRVEAGAEAGTAQGRKKRYNEVTVRLYNTVGATVNGDQIPFRTSASPMGQPISSFTGDKRVSNLGWDRDGQVTVQQTQPLPMTILGITGTLVTSD